MQVIVPVGSEATVYVPLRKNKQITENDQPINDTGDLKLIREEPDYMVFAVKSGNYQFLSK